MKLTKTHLFIILLLVLLFSSFTIKVLEGMNVIEGNSNISNSTQSLANMKHGGSGKSLTSGHNGSSYNPFGTSQNSMTDKDFKKARKIGSDVRVEFKKLGLATLLFKKFNQELKNKNIQSLKIDTHEDNLGMQALIKKMGYTYCGIIYTRGNKRLAFEKILIS